MFVETNKIIFNVDNLKINKSIPLLEWTIIKTLYDN